MWRRSRSTNIYFILDSWREKENFMLNIHTIYVTFPLVSAMKKTKCSRESHPSGSDLFLIMPGPLGWKWCRRDPRIPSWCYSKIAHSSNRKNLVLVISSLRRYYRGVAGASRRMLRSTDGNVSIRLWNFISHGRGDSTLEH